MRKVIPRHSLLQRDYHVHVDGRVDEQLNDLAPCFIATGYRILETRAAKYRLDYVEVATEFLAYLGRGTQPATAASRQQGEDDHAEDPTHSHGDKHHQNEDAEGVVGGMDANAEHHVDGGRIAFRLAVKGQCLEPDVGRQRNEGAGHGDAQDGHHHPAVEAAAFALALSHEPKAKERQQM